MATDRNAEQAPLFSEAALIRHLADGIVEAGGTVVDPPAGKHGRRADLEFRWKGLRFVVELKAAQVNRIPILQALLSSALLESQRIAHDVGGHPLPVLGVELLSDRTLQALDEHMKFVAPEAEWGVIDLRGRRRFHGPKLRALDQEGRAQPRAPAAAKAGFDVFTDLGQWMAKVLLAPRVPQEMLAAPRERIRNARHLAQVSNVSEPTAARWVQHMKSEGFIEDSHDGLRLVRHRALLEAWKTVLARPRREHGARFLLPSGSASSHANFVVARYCFERIEGFNPDNPPTYPGALRWKTGPRACLGMFEAANAHGLARISGAPVHLYLESISHESAKTFDLARLRGAEHAEVTLVEPRFPEATFRGAVLSPRPGGSKVAVVDVIQSWLELGQHPARGREAAEDIERQLIGPWLLKADERGT
jgi:hypothetical protein